MDVINERKVSSSNTELVGKDKCSFNWPETLSHWQRVSGPSYWTPLNMALLITVKIQCNLQCEDVSFRVQEALSM